MQDCVFCKIAAGQIPATKIYEDKEVLAFLDIAPIAKGHALVVPKRHATALHDLPDALLGKAMAVAKKIAPDIVKAVKAEGYNIGINNGSAAGQVVMHAHIHIIPRIKNDGLKHWPGGKYGEGEMEQYGQRIRSFIKVRQKPHF